MTAAIDKPTEELVEEAAPAGNARRRRVTPPGAEQMARPWRLGIIGLGVAIGLISRLLAANGVTELMTDGMIYSAAITSVLAGVGLLTQSAERDRFGRWMILLSVMTGLSLGALQWISPFFPTGTLEWSDGTQFALAVLGVGNGILFAGVLTLALVRRWPTMTVVAVLVGAVLTLAANSVLLRNEWPAIVALAMAFLFVLVAWDRAPRHEPVYRAQEGSPRISRAALSLATVALSGAGIQLWVSRGEDIGRAVPAVVLSVVLLIGAFMAMIRIRREIQQRDTTLSEWTSWMREFRTGDLRTDFETMGTTESGLSIGDLTAEPPRPLSFPDLRLDDGKEPFHDLRDPVEDTAPPAGPPTEPIAPIEVVIPGEDISHQIPTDEASMAEDVSGDDITDLAVPSLENLAEPMPALVQPTLFGDQQPTSFELAWAESEAGLGQSVPDESIVDAVLGPLPVIADDQPSLFDFEQSTDVETPGEAPVAAVPAALPAIDVPEAPAPPETPPIEAAPPETPQPLEAPDAPDAPIVPAPETPEIVVPAPAAAGEAIVIPLTPKSKQTPPAVIEPPPAPVEAPVAPPVPVPTPTPVPAPAASSAFSAHAGPKPAPPATPRPTGGAFSDWLGAEKPSLITTPEQLAAWLAVPPAPDTSRLIAAIETMSLADFDMLPAEVSQAMNDALQTMLEGVEPEPTQVTAIDGPYLMVAWDHIERSRLSAVNKMLIELLSSPVETSEGAVGLSGTLALLQPGADATFDQVIDDAITGLVRARQLEALAKAN